MRGLPTREQIERNLSARRKGTATLQETPYAPIFSAIEGVVQAVDDAGQLLMRWDNGWGLSLIPGGNGFSIISRAEQAQEEADLEQQMGGMKFE